MLSAAEKGRTCRAYGGDATERSRGAGRAWNRQAQQVPWLSREEKPNRRSGEARAAVAYPLNGVPTQSRLTYSSCRFLEVLRMSSELRAVVLSPAVSHPRFHRRVEAIQRAGVRPVVYAFRRGWYEVNKFPPGADVIDLGPVPDGKYLARLPRLGKAFAKIRRAEATFETQPQFVLALGVDLALLARWVFSSSVPLIYEIGDLRGVNSSGPIRWAVARIEREIVRRARTLIVTSPGFLSEYYEKIDPTCRQKAVVIENKLPKSFGGAERPVVAKEIPSDRRIRIGVVGLLRYPRTLLPLVEAVAQRSTRYELHVYGDGPLRSAVEEEAGQFENIYYHGPFRNPDDLAAIYSYIDLNYVVYDNNEPNVRLALPNKLYESTFFAVPIIVAERTALADRVRAMATGFIISPNERDFVGKFLDGLSRPAIIKRSRNSLAVPMADLIEDNDQSTEWIRKLL